MHAQSNICIRVPLQLSRHVPLQLSRHVPLQLSRNVPLQLSRHVLADQQRRNTRAGEEMHPRALTDMFHSMYVYVGNIKIMQMETKDDALRHLQSGYSAYVYAYVCV